MRIGSWWSIGVMLWAGAAVPVHAQVLALPQIAIAPQLRPGAVAPTTGPAELTGIVKDDAGKPLAGAVVSALGPISAFAISDSEGRFVLRNLAPGSYLVRAHLQNYLPVRGRVLQVIPDRRTSSTIELTRSPGESDEPKVLAASVGSTEATPSTTPDTEERHDHDALAWRLRHLKRSVLKDEGSTIDVDDSVLGESLSTMGRAVGNSARLATALFTDLQVTGQFNLLTSTSFERPQDLFSLNGVAPRGVAYLSIETPGPDGDWTMRGTMTQGDLASWILAGSFRRHKSATHAYEAGVAYGMQRYLGGNGEALAAMRDGSRNVGSMYAMDNWTVLPRLSVGYGAKYARYDYLDDRGLISPRATITFQPSPDDPLSVRATVLHREVAPGAEEFIPPTTGLWLPPERTFSQVSHRGFVPERHDQVELALERELPGAVLVGVRAFREEVEDQLVTVFGVAVGDTPAEIGHYQIGSAGDFSAHGWGVTLTRAVGDHVHATVDYTQASTTWRTASPDAEALATVAPSALRAPERVHDLTASVESTVAPSLTRVLVVYKLNAAFSSSNAAESTPTTGLRFDVQVNQGLPFLNFTNAQWEMLVAVSNLFKEALYENSVYDELFVVRPPKRVVGGVTVRF